MEQLFNPTKEEIIRMTWNYDKNNKFSGIIWTQDKTKNSNVLWESTYFENNRYMIIIENPLIDGFYILVLCNINDDPEFSNQEFSCVDLSYSNDIELLKHKGELIYNIMVE